MKTYSLNIKTTGFHVIPAKSFTSEAARFESEIRVIWENWNIISDGKSILGLMALELKPGDSVTITAEGPDEEAAILRLQTLTEELL